jgi:1,5-anhydro-D-fructose reductase (1,5-anhydro-D-mannitol-forming)
MPKTPLRYAIIGFGGIAENRIAKEGFARDSARFKPLPGIELVAAADVSSARRPAAQSLGLKWYDSPDAAIADSSIDAVFIASNNASHFALGKKALEAGKHVILEKPMATRLDDARKLVDLAATRNLSLAVDHMMVHNAYSIAARHLIAAGALGQVNDITLHMEFCYGATPEEAATWRCARPSELGGPIGDVGSHCLYMAEFLMGSPVRSVAAVFTPRTLKIRAENGAFIRFLTESGLTGSARVSFNDARGSLTGTLLNLGYEVYGTRASLRSCGALFQLSGHSGEPVRLRLEIEEAGACREIHVNDVQNIYQKIILDHAEAIRSGRRQTGEDGLHNLALVEAAYRSARQGGKSLAIK